MQKQGREWLAGWMLTLCIAIGLTGCGMGGALLPLGLPIAEEILFEATTDVTGAASLNVDGVEHLVLVEDELTGAPVGGLRLAGAEDGTGLAVLVIDETGTYAAALRSFADIGSRKPDGSVAMRIRLPQAGTPGGPGRLNPTDEIGPEVQAMFRTWAEETGYACEW